MWSRIAVGFGLVMFGACGDAVAVGTDTETGGTSTTEVATTPLPTTSGNDTTTAEPVLPECPDRPDSVSVVSSVEACADPACGDVLIDGFPPVATEVEGDFYADRTFECRVEGVAQQDGERWTLGDCTGADVPASGAVRITYASSPGPGLPLVIGERVVLRYHGGATYNNDHYSWSLTDEGGTLLALVSRGLFLPPDGVSAPLELKGEPHACGKSGVCGGYLGDSDLVVSLGEDVVKVAGGTADLLPGSPTYRVLVSYATYDGPSGCGIFDWRESYNLAVVVER